MQSLRKVGGKEYAVDEWYMDVVNIKPFWIVLSFVYFWLAAKHYYRQFVITPSTYVAAANTPAPDNNPFIPIIFQQFINEIEKDRQLMWLATVGFFVGGVVFLLQGITDLEWQTPIPTALALAGAVFVLLIIYRLWPWVFVPITGRISSWWWRRQAKLLEKKRSAQEPQQEAGPGGSQTNNIPKYFFIFIVGSFLTLNSFLGLKH